MAKLIVPLALLLLPLTARAEPIFVDYVGKVGTLQSDGDPITDFYVGQPIRGRLIIDTVLAGPDRNDPYPGIGSYSNPGVDFITGGPETLPFGSPRDQVWSDVYTPLRSSRYHQIVDASMSDLDDYSSFQINVSNLPHELSDDRLLKAFKAEPKKDGSMISSALVRIKNGVQSSVQFLIDKVSYMPQSCMAP
jgi:hypothetical protein